MFCLDDNKENSMANWLQLSFTLGSNYVHKLIEFFGSPKKIFQSGKEACKKFLSPQQLENLFSPNIHQQKHIQNALAWEHASDHNHLIHVQDSSYPAILLASNNPPPVLFVQGSLECLSFPIFSIVGSREGSRAGCQIALDFSSNLSKNGLTIVSGLAQGIDTAAHKGAILEGKPTIAVIGTGIDRIFPEENTQLSEQIKKNGAIISEFALGTPPLRKNFPRRNRIIAGLSLGVLVVEAAKKSGSLITAHQAADLGREVMAVPGSIHSALSKGCHDLIREGAKLVETAEDVLLELPKNWQKKETFLSSKNNSFKQLDLFKDLGNSSSEEEYQTFLIAMGWDPVDTDTIARNTHYSLTKVRSTLVKLEMAGQIERGQDGRFSRLKSHHSLENSQEKRGK